MNLRVPNRLRKSHNLLILSLLLASGIALGQDAVNPCEILSETINCTAPGMHGAEIDFKTIKLNGKRKTNPMANVGDALVISTGIRYTKRAKVELTTTFNGGCPPRTETKRMKPDVNVTYTATLDGNSYSGTGAEFTLTAPLAIGSYPLVVTFTGAAANGCIDNAPITESNTFLLDVIDGAYILNLTSQKTGTATPVAEGTYLCKGQGQQLDFNVTFSDPLANLPFSANDIVWTVSPSDAGTFTGPSGANGDTVTWTQADDFVSALEDDLVITVNAPDMQPRTFALTVFGVNSTSGVLAPNSTQTFLIENANIEPADANKSIIVAALGGITDVGTGTATKLRTRTFTGASPFGQLESEAFLPAEGDQTNPALQIIKKATFMLSGSDLMVEIQSGPVVGDVNITWEQDRPGGTRQILHREHMTVTTGMPAHSVTLIEKGSNKRKTGGNLGPLYKTYLDPLEVEAIIDPGPPVAGYPKWTITHNLAGVTVPSPSDGDTELDTTTWLPGHYIIETKLGNDPAEKSQIEVNVVQVDLDVDTNRNGTVADDDDAGEDSWSIASGAIFAVNYDDDDGTTNGIKSDSVSFDTKGDPIDEDTKVNNSADADDIAHLIIRKVGSVDNIQYFLKVDASDLKAIHIFQERAAGKEVLKDGSGNDWSGWNAHSGDSGPQIVDVTALVRTQGDLDLGIESLFFPGGKVTTASYTFDGEVTIEIIAQKGSGNPGLIPANFISSDIVKLRVAPYLLLPNTQNGLEVFMDSHTDADGLELGFGSGLSRRVTPSTGSQWFQDHVQIGFTGLPGKEVYSTLRVPYKFFNGSPKFQDDWPAMKLLKPDHGVMRMRNYYFHDGLGGSGDFGGNLEIVPKSDDWPLGRVIIGNNMSPGMQSFLNAQSADGGQAVQKPFTVDVSWLSVGHVDEMIGFAPDGAPSPAKGYKVVQADTTLAKDLLSTGAFGISPPPPHAPLFSTPEYAHGIASNIVTTSGKRFLFDGIAHGYIKCIKKSSINDTSTVTIGDGTTTLVFEFDKNGAFTSPNVQVDLSSVSTATEVRDLLKSTLTSQFILNSIPFIATEDGTDGILLFCQDFGTSYNQTITETVSNSGFQVTGMSGGQGAPGTGPVASTGVDFTTDTWTMIRLYDGTGHGQVGIIKSRGKGWIALETAMPYVCKTTSKIIWNPGNGEDGLYKYASIKNPVPRSTNWFTEPDGTTKYVVTKGSTMWIDSAPSLVPALWTVHEILAETEMWTFNAEAQAFVDSAVAKITTEMGMETGTANTFLKNEGDYLDDSLTGDSNDDFVSVPALYMGSRNDTVGGTFYPGLAKGNTFAFVPGFANFQPVSSTKMVFPIPFMPFVVHSGAWVDLFEQACDHVIGSAKTIYADDWNGYHRYEGEVHCGTSVKRDLFPDEWWMVIQ